MSGARPCASCPWLRQNQTKAARKASPKAVGSAFKWYDVRNLRRLWKGYQTGFPTLCHSTDPEAIGYGGGKEIDAGHERVCVGGLIMTARAMNEVNRRCADDPTGKKPWRGLFSRDGMLYWIDTLMFRGTQLGVAANKFPTTFDGDAAKNVRAPWDDPILNADSLPPLET